LVESPNPSREENTVTRPRDYNAIQEVVELLAHDGFDGLGEAIRRIINEAMRLERQNHLGVDPYERSEHRRGQANGYKPKTVQTRVGALELDVPQVRDSSFYPSSLEKGLRSERALKIALAEMYIQGVSTRKVAKITEQLCGFEVTSTQVSRAAKDLDGVLEQWRNRPLGAYTYVYLDARYEKVRHNGSVISMAVLVAIGVSTTGHRQILGTSVSLSEQEVHWREFLRHLQQRGLHGVKLFISDAHEGLKAARTAVFPSVPWQRCQFHLQQNAQAYVPKQTMRKEVAQCIRSVFNAPSEEEARRLLDQLLTRYEKSAPRLVAWAETNIPEGLTVFQFPADHWRRIRTSNPLERTNKEIRRRTRVATIFPNEGSCLRLVSAVLMEISEEWETGRVYLSF
jgi:transposase-like protein